jgi:hypothetical protein
LVSCSELARWWHNNGVRRRVRPEKKNGDVTRRFLQARARGGRRGRGGIEHGRVGQLAPCMRERGRAMAGCNARLGAVYGAHAGQSLLRCARVHRGASRASVHWIPVCTVRGRHKRRGALERAGAVRRFNLFATFRLKRTRDL